MPCDPSKPILEPAEALRQSQIYDDFEDDPEMIETHISYLFLTEDYVYKLKKPVDFGFLDYSTTEKRHEACRAELQINRRLAPDVYLDVVPVGCDDRGNWVIGGSGIKPRDWLVKMKRLPDDRCLKAMIQASSWTEVDIKNIIDTLVSFYQSLEPIEVVPPPLLPNVVDNQHELEKREHALDPGLVRRVHAAQRQFLFLHQSLLDNRLADGRLIEGHGDLRAEHVYATNPVVVIDGIEFSRDLRIVDIADELCFFAVTCDVLDAPEIGKRVLWGVLGAFDDQPDERLLQFYRCYRACVRAKVQSLRAAQVTGSSVAIAQDRAETYLQIAQRSATKLHRPIALVVRGLSGTGKSTLARALSNRLGTAYFSTDQIRKRENVASNYSEAARHKVYCLMVDQAVERLNEFESVVLDGTFLTDEQVRLAASAIDTSDVEFAIVTCNCPDETAISRIRERRKAGDSESDADENVFRQQQELAEPVSVEWTDIEINTTESLDCQLQQLQARLTLVART